MIEQGPGPGVQHGQSTWPPTQVLRIEGQLLQSGRGRAQQQAIDFFLVSKGQRAQLRWQGKGDQEVGTGQKPSLLLRQPALSLVPMTLGTVAVGGGRRVAEPPPPAGGQFLVAAT